MASGEIVFVLVFLCKPVTAGTGGEVGRENVQPEGSGAAIRAAADGARAALILTRRLVWWGAAGVYKK